MLIRPVFFLMESSQFRNIGAENYDFAAYYLLSSNLLVLS